MTRLRLLLAATTLLLATACSGSGDGDADSAADSAGDDATEEATDEDTAAEGGAGGTGSATGASADLVAAQVARQVIRTAEVSLTVDDVAEAAVAAVRIAEDAGGFQAEGTLALAGDDEDDGAAVVVRVPAAAFGDVLDAIGELGEVADQRIGSEDVTDQVVDLDARIAAAQVSVERVRGFLDDATDVIQLATVERELLNRETELEVLVAQQQALADQVALATITARFGAEAAPPLDDEPRPAASIPGPIRALRHGWVLLVDAARVVLAVVAFSAPFLPVLAAALVVVRLRRGRARRLAA